MVGSAATQHGRARATEARRRVRAGPRHVLVYGVAVAVAVVAVQSAANLIDFGVYDYRFAAVNPNDETSLFAWVGGIAIGFSALVCLVRSYRLPAERRPYLVTGLLLAFVAVENRARFHEEAVHRPAIYVPLLGALTLALLWLSRRWPAPAKHAVWAGLVALAWSFALHKVAPHLLADAGYGPGDWPYELKVSLKESGELCGWILIATGLVAAAPGRTPEGEVAAETRADPLLPVSTRPTNPSSPPAREIAP
jgi:hypothetical protein